MPVIRKGQDKWLVRVFIGRDENGKTQFFNEIFHGKKKEADAYEAKKKGELIAGVALEHSKTTLDEYLDKWLKISAKTRLHSRTYGDYVEYLQRYVRPKIGKLNLTKLKPLDIQAVYTAMLERRSFPANGSIHSFHSVFVIETSRQVADFTDESGKTS